jgi:hypothetical protein
MYKHGHELPEFAMYPLLDDPRAVADLTDMYTRYFEVAAEHGFVALGRRPGLPRQPGLGVKARDLARRARRVPAAVDPVPA